MTILEGFPRHGIPGQARQSRQGARTTEASTIDGTGVAPLVATEAVDTADLRAAFHHELLRSTRESGLLAGTIAVIAFPAWGLFDTLLLPDRAAAFMAVRLAFEIPMLLAFLALLWRPLGERWPEQLTFALLALVELAIAWMIPRSQPQLEAYLLGYSLAIYGSAFLLTWRWQLTAQLVAFTIAATAGFILVREPRPSDTEMATVAFYLLTAGAIAIAAQVHRYRTAWQQFITQSALELERQRNERLVAELDDLSRQDHLTGVPNRRAWDAWIRTEFPRTKRAQSPLALIFCDFDHFKSINDEHGHAVGDAVLKTGAALFLSRVRVSDFVARIGGDEFLIACPDTSLDGATKLVQDLVVRARDTPWPCGVPATVSFGVAELHPDDDSPEQLLARADVALYSAKATRGAVSPAQ